MKILFLPEVLEYFNELTTLLYKQDYFSFEENAIEYVSSLIDDIHDTLDIKVSKAAPPYFCKYGKSMRYAVFKKNRNTLWYVFFVKYQSAGETICLVRHITNNHVSAKYL